jgi:hypothetical protein
VTYPTHEVEHQEREHARWSLIVRNDWLASVEDIEFEHRWLGCDIPFSGDLRPRPARPVEERRCLQCGESEAAIRASQRRGDPLYCAIVDYWGECEADWPRHRFRDTTDAELKAWGVLPRYWYKYRRVFSGWEIADEHRVPKTS